MAENLNLKINLTGEEKVVKSVGELRRAIKTAEMEALALTMQFGEADPRVLKIRESVGALKNQMADAAQQAKAFSEDSAFPAVAQSVQGIASAFTAVQGAMALFGVENEAVEKTLVKLNAAMALSQGLGGVVEAIDSFKVLNSMIQSSTALKKADIVVTRLATGAQAALATATGATTISLQALKAAIVSTGIGALVVGVGILVSKLMEWADSSEDAEKANKALNDEIERQNELIDENLKGIDYVTKKQIADARKRGASAKELRDIEVNGDKERLQALKKASADADALQIKTLNNTKATEEQKAEAKKNATEASKKYNDELLNQELANAEYAADQAEDRRKKDADATDKARQKAKAKREKDNEELAAAKKEAADIELEAFKATLSEQEREEYEAQQAFIKNREALQKAGIKDFALIEEQLQIQLKEIKKKYSDEQAEEDQTKEELNLQLRKANGLVTEDEYQKQLYDIKKKYAKSSEELQTAEIAYIEYTNKRKEELAEEERSISLSKLQGQLEDLDRKNQESDFDFQQDLERIAQQRQILADQEMIELQNTELTEDKRNEVKKKYSDARMKLTADEVETEKAAQQAKVDLNNKYLDLAGQFGSLLQQIAGKNKALAIAGIVVEQVSAISKIISNTAAANAKSVAASPLTAGMPFVAINNISAGISIASSIASAAKSIQQIKAQGGAAASGGGSLSTDTIKGGGAPMGAVPPQVNETRLNQESINALGNQAIRAYVIESDVTTNQQRIAAIRQRARFS